MRSLFSELPIGLARVTMVVLFAGCPVLAQADLSAPLPNWLLPPNVYGSSLLLPGERWEGQLTGERNIALRPGMEWQTRTDLHRTRFEQMYPARAQGFSLSTGPQIRLGAAEFSLPWSAGRNSSSIGGASSWSSGSPRMTVALGPWDRVRLEAKLSRRREGSSTQRRRTTSLSWRHSFSNNWSLTTGLREVRETGDADTSISAETYASVDAWFGDDWRWSLGSSLLDNRSTRLPALQRDRSASLSLSTRYRLPDGWWISGELQSTQTYRGDEQRPLSHSGGLKLFRDF